MNIRKVIDRSWQRVRGGEISILIKDLPAGVGIKEAEETREIIAEMDSKDELLVKASQVSAVTVPNRDLSEKSVKALTERGFCLTPRGKNYTGTFVKELPFEKTENKEGKPRFTIQA